MVVVLEACFDQMEGDETSCLGEVGQRKVSAVACFHGHHLSYAGLEDLDTWEENYGTLDQVLETL